MSLDPSQDVPSAKKLYLDSGCAVTCWSILEEKSVLIRQWQVGKPWKAFLEVVVFLSLLVLTLSSR